MSFAIQSAALKSLVFKAIDFIARLYRRAHSAHSPETQTSDTLLRSVFLQDKGEGR